MRERNTNFKDALTSFTKSVNETVAHISVRSTNVRRLRGYTRAETEAPLEARATIAAATSVATRARFGDR